MCGGLGVKGKGDWGAFRMEHAKLHERIEGKIAECRERYEKDKHDSFNSHVRASERDTLEVLYDRIRKDGPSAALQEDLRKRLCELEKEKEREEHCPSFSWYGEHYHYLVLEGACDAYRGMIGLLEEKCSMPDSCQEKDKKLHEK